MSPLKPRCAPTWMASLGEHDARDLFEPDRPPPPLDGLEVDPSDVLFPPSPRTLRARALAKARTVESELARFEHHICALDSPCP